MSIFSSSLVALGSHILFVGRDGQFYPCLVAVSIVLSAALNTYTRFSCGVGAGDIFGELRSGIDGFTLEKLWYASERLYRGYGRVVADVYTLNSIIPQTGQRPVMHSNGRMGSNRFSESRVPSWSVTT